MDQHPTVDAGSEHIPAITNLPPVEGTEQLSAVTNLVIMSGSKKVDAFVHLRKIVHISEQQEEAIRLAIKRTYQNASINPYRKKRGRPAGTTNKPEPRDDERITEGRGLCLLEEDRSNIRRARRGHQVVH